MSPSLKYLQSQTRDIVQGSDVQDIHSWFVIKIHLDGAGGLVIWETYARYVLLTESPLHLGCWDWGESFQPRIKFCSLYLFCILILF